MRHLARWGSGLTLRQSSAVSVLRGGASRFGVYVMAAILRRLAIAILAGVVVVIYAAGVATGAMVF